MLPSIPGSPVPDDRTRIVASVVRVDDRTTVVPVLRRPSRLRTLLPWAGFGVVAVAVVAATSAWSATLRSGDEPLLMNAAPPAAVVGPAPAPTPDVTTGPEPTRSRVAKRPAAASAAAPAAARVSTTPTARPTVAAPAPTTRTAPAPTATRRVGLLGGAGQPGCSPPQVCPARTGTNPAP